MLVMAISMAVATFVENDHGTAYARWLIYDSWWFELILFWLTASFIYHIPKYRLFSAKKWPIGLLHLSLIVILFGAGVTRYIAQEGIMPIREDQMLNHFYTLEKYLQIKEDNKIYSKPLHVIAKGFEPKSEKLSVDNNDFNLRIVGYKQGAREQWHDGTETFLDIAVAQEDGRKDYLVLSGDNLALRNMPLAFGNQNAQAFVNIAKIDNIWQIRMQEPAQVIEMATQEMGIQDSGVWRPLRKRSLYQWEYGTIMIKDIHENKERVFIKEEDEELAKELPDMVDVQVYSPENELLTEKSIMVTTRQPEWFDFTYQGKQYSFTYGPQVKNLPFHIKLREFELKRYPGSTSPSGYASEVTVFNEDLTQFDYRIFMNNVLDHKGYRFYQASYDEDEQGTLLAVNQDRPGTIITYIGYTLLTISMIIILFWRNSRFGAVNRKIGKVQSKASAVILLLLMLSSSIMQAQDSNPATVDSTQIEVPVSESDVRIYIVPQEHADQYGRIIVQDLDGRMKPVSTLAYEIIRKLTGKTSIVVPQKEENFVLSPEQFLLAVQMNPGAFSDLPMLQIAEKKSAPLFQKLNVQPTGTLRFLDLVDKQGNYIILDDVNRVNRLKPSERSEFDKEILKLDERFNIFYAVMIGDFMRIFPNRLDDNDTWFTSTQWQQGFDEEDGTFVRNISQIYLTALRNGNLTGDYTEANESLAYIDMFQRKAGDTVYPSDNEIKAELFYTKTRISNYLFVAFIILGLLMLILAIIQIFKAARILSILWMVGVVLAAIGLLFFTFELGLRWYIAKHPPWSDGFEMMLFVAWGVLVFGIAFMRKSRFTLPLGLLGSGILLFVSYLDWLNPEITNLMPVLHSYWLKIHVSIIVASYAPLALAAIIALLCLFLLIFKPNSATKQWFGTIQELSAVVEMAITIGLFLLTIGTFLGGVWANESWGRYWAWDPKETWALISIMVYAIVLHLRLIPAMRNSFVFFLAALWAFSSIIMTSYGVNYYLSGLHSYATGDPIPIPMWVYYAVLLLVVVSVVSAVRYARMKSAEKLQFNR